MVMLVCMCEDSGKCVAVGAPGVWKAICLDRGAGWRRSVGGDAGVCVCVCEDSGKFVAVGAPAVWESVPIGALVGGGL